LKQAFGQEFVTC